MVHTIISCRLRLHSGIHLKTFRIQKKNKNRDVWIFLKSIHENQQRLREKYKVECKFGEGKQGHSLGSCCYVGMIQFAIQVLQIANALNIKPIVKILTGMNFKVRGIACV